MLPKILSLLALLSVSAQAGSNSVVNLSHYDEGRPNFAQMKGEGVIAAIHEATYPSFTQDSEYGSRQNAAARAGLLWGAYHFGNADDPVRQADHLLEVVGSHWRRAETRPPGVLLVLDFEENNHYPGGTMRVEQAVAFIKRIQQKTGKYPGLYSNENRIKQVLNSPKVDSESKQVLQKCWLWIANYHYKPESTGPWSKWHLWQYTGDGICDLPRKSYPVNLANLRKVERNIFEGSAGALRDFWQERSWVPGL